MSKARNLANLLADGAVGASELASTLDLSGKTMTLPAGVGGHASGDEASRPASPSIGTTYFNTDEDTLQQYTATGWKNIGGGVTTDSEANRPATPAVGTLFFNTTQDTLQQYTAQGWQDVGPTPPNIGGITGNIYNGAASSLTIAGNGFGTASTVRFTVGGSATDVSVSNNDTSITVSVPSAIYNQTSGTTVSISVIVNGKTTAGSNKTVIASPSGGVITTSGTYRIHTFTSSSNLVVPSGVTLSDVEYVVVAGGGGGGGGQPGAGVGGGGGAGGYRSSVTGESSGGGSLAENKLTLSSGSYQVVVGLGGTGASGGNTPTNGQVSSFHTIESIGGGFGGRPNADATRTTGSGGSGGGNGQEGDNKGIAPGSGTTGQGFSGGANAGVNSAGGGGGAGGSGASGLTGTGGAGVTSSVTGSPVARAGGGGGGRHANQGGTASGRDGGGNGTTVNGGNGSQYTGGGGGGAGEAGGTYTGGNGGDGIVIVRYQL